MDINIKIITIPIFNIVLRNVTDHSDFDDHQFVPADKYKHLSDAEVIEKVLSGATHFFEILMRRYNQRLFRLQRSYISDEEAIKDTLQSTYLKAFKSLDSFRGEAQFSTWISRIAINEALKYLNKQKRYSNLHLVDGNKPMNEHTIDTDENPEQEAIQKDLKHFLEAAVGSLAPKYRSVYVMREIEGMNTKETAECLEISRSNVKVRLHRAKKKVQKKLEQTVADTEIFNFLGDQCDRLVYSVMHEIKEQTS